MGGWAWPAAILALLATPAFAETLPASIRAEPQPLEAAVRVLRLDGVAEGGGHADGLGGRVAGLGGPTCRHGDDDDERGKREGSDGRMGFGYARQ